MGKNNSYEKPGIYSYKTGNELFTWDDIIKVVRRDSTGFTIAPYTLDDVIHFLKIEEEIKFVMPYNQEDFLSFLKLNVSEDFLKSDGSNLVKEIVIQCDGVVDAYWIKDNARDDVISVHLYNSNMFFLDDSYRCFLENFSNLENVYVVNEDEQIKNGILVINGNLIYIPPKNKYRKIPEDVTRILYHSFPNPSEIVVVPENVTYLDAMFGVKKPSKIVMPNVKDITTDCLNQLSMFNVLVLTGKDNKINSALDHFKIEHRELTLDELLDETTFSMTQINEMLNTYNSKEER